MKDLLRAHDFFASSWKLHLTAKGVAQRKVWESMYYMDVRIDIAMWDVYRKGGRRVQLTSSYRLPFLSHHFMQLHPALILSSQTRYLIAFAFVPQFQYVWVDPCVSVRDRLLSLNAYNCRLGRRQQICLNSWVIERFFCARMRDGII